ncbi:MAG: anthranilate synthase component II [Desulfobacterales bacterium]
MPGMLVIDNYDSFAHNLVQLFLQFGLDIEVYRSDRISIREVESRAPARILISPGPGDPQTAGISVDLVRAFAGRIPILGVCLGMQCINEAFGGSTVRAPVPVHGKTSRIFHDATGLFTGLPSPFTAARYHSLVSDGTGKGLQACAWTSNGVLMGLSDPGRMLYGLQFHPESFMTEFGIDMAEKFLFTKKPGQIVCHAG